MTYKNNNKHQQQQLISLKMITNIWRRRRRFFDHRRHHWGRVSWQHIKFIRLIRFIWSFRIITVIKVVSAALLQLFTESIIHRFTAAVRVFRVTIIRCITSSKKSTFRVLKKKVMLRVLILTESYVHNNLDNLQILNILNALIGAEYEIRLIVINQQKKKSKKER